MTNTFLGISLILWSALCLGVAVVYAFVWPKPRAPRPAWSAFVLRWFHSLVWALLATACLLWAASIPSMLAQGLALLALVFYSVFMVTFLRDRQRQNNKQ